MGHAARILALATLFMSAWAVSACGGGGGGGGDESVSPNTRLTGLYGYLFLDRQPDIDAVHSEIAAFTADGEGNLVFSSGWRHGEGGPAVMVRRANTSYAVNGDNRLGIYGGFPGLLEGSISTDGQYAIATAQETGDDPGWLCAARVRPDPLPGDLAGYWTEVQWSRDAGHPDWVNLWYDQNLQIDPAGAVTHNFTWLNSNGSINTGPFVYISSNFTVDGPWVHLWTLGAQSATGFLSEDGNVMLLGTRVAGGQASVQLLVRTQSGYDEDTLAGEWRLSGFAAARPGYTCYSGVTTCGAGDGDGTWFADPNWEGTGGMGTTVISSFSVHGTGETHISWDEGSYMRGGFTQRFGIQGGPWNTDTDPQIHVFVR